MTLPVTVDPERVAAYVRWSTDEQGEGTTLAVQCEACEHYIRSQGWQFRPDLLFVDDGCSGGSLDRPGLSALRQAVGQGRVTGVVVYKLDRLSRSVLDTVNLILQEWEGLCHVKSTREPIDTTTPTGKIFFYMLASYAEWERSVIRERTLAGKAKRAQQGKNPGFTYPYGYRPGANKGQWAVDAAEAAVIRRVFAEYTQGHGAAAIAAGLNREGIRSRHGGLFQPSRIHHLLLNRCYTGVLAYGRTALLPPAARRRVGQSRVRFATPRHALVEGALPAIVTPEEFAAALAVRQSRGGLQGRKALSGQWLLSGIVRCRCGALLSHHCGGRSATGYYRCGRAHAGAAQRCDCALIPADRLEAAIAGQLRAAYVEAQRRYLRADLTAATERRRQAATAALVAARSALAALQRRRRRLDADYDAGQLPAALYAERVAALADEEGALQAAQVAHEAGLAELQGAPGLPEAAATGVDGWELLDPEERKQVLRHALAGCTAYRPPSARGSGAPVEVAITLWQPA